MSFEKIRDMIAEYEKTFLHQKMQLAVDHILEDQKFLSLTTEEKVIFAILLCAKAN